MSAEGGQVVVSSFRVCVGRNSRLPLDKRLCLTRAEVGELCGLTPAAVSAWVRKGILPPPIAGTQRFDRRAVEKALDNAAGRVSHDDSGDVYDSWKATRKCA